MAELTGSGNQGDLNSTTPVELVPAPSSGFRMVRSGYIHNSDASYVTIHLAKKISSTYYQFHSQLLDTGDTLEIGDGDMIILGTGESLYAWIDESPGVEPSFLISFGDK